MVQPRSQGTLSTSRESTLGTRLQMVISDFEEEKTGTEHVAIATSKCEPSGIFCRVQHPCQV